MDNITPYLHYLWFLIPLFAIVFYKFTLRVFFGMIIIPENKIGLVTKRWALFGTKKRLPDGKIIALEGEAGYQADTLAPGLYWGYWIWQYEITEQSFTQIPSGKIGLVIAKDGNQLPTGHILARHVNCDNFTDARSFLMGGGQKGKQVSYLNTGVYRINTLLFDIAITDLTTIEEGKVGIITCLDGVPLEKGTIAGVEMDNKIHNNFQDFDKFLDNGGQRGLQPPVIQAGTYSLNPWAVQIEKVPMTEIPIGHVGVVISFIGEEGKDLTGESFKHGNIVSKGQRGVWSTPYDPGKYPINPYIMKVELVPTTNLVLNWANARSESHNLDSKLCTITVRSKDGFPFNLDVSQIIHIPSTEAPKVIARFGSMLNLVSQVLEPTIGNYFRNSAQNSDVISFLSTRTDRQKDAKAHIKAVLDEYNVNAVDTLIGDIVPPESLMKTLTDRKIAAEQKITFDTQKEAEDRRKEKEAASALADMQPKMVVAQQSVEISQREAEAAVKKAEGEKNAMVLKSEGEGQSLKIKAEGQAKAKVLLAEADATQIKLTGEAEATKIGRIGEETAQAYQKQVAAMGAENFAKFKITEEISKGRIKITPDVLIGGGGQGGTNDVIAGLLSLDLTKKIRDVEHNQPAIVDTVTEEKTGSAGSKETGKK